MEPMYLSIQQKETGKQIKKLLMENGYTVKDVQNAMGSRQTVSSELTPQEFHLNCRSDRAALIACDGLDTVRTVTGREYHYSLCGSWRNRELPDILSR